MYSARIIYLAREKALSEVGEESLLEGYLTARIKVANYLRSDLPKTGRESHQFWMKQGSLTSELYIGQLVTIQGFRDEVEKWENDTNLHRTVASTVSSHNRPCKATFQTILLLTLTVEQTKSSTLQLATLTYWYSQAP